MRLLVALVVAAALAASLAQAARAQDLTLNVTVSGDGEVVSSPEGIACPGACIATFAEETTVTLTAQAGVDTFDEWGGACEGTEPECTLVIDPTSVEATFSSGNGSGPPPPPPIAPPPPDPEPPDPEPPGPPPPRPSARP